jgi:hypothetical protein
MCKRLSAGVYTCMTKSANALLLAGRPPDGPPPGPRPQPRNGTVGTHP